MILNLETVFLIQVSDHDTENLHFPGVGEEAARCEIFFCSSECLFVKPQGVTFFFNKVTSVKEPS